MMTEEKVYFSHPVRLREKDGIASFSEKRVSWKGADGKGLAIPLGKIQGLR